MPDKKTEEHISNFCGITGASTKEARGFLDRYKRLDVAIDAFYNDSSLLSSFTVPPSRALSTKSLNTLFDKYKDPDGDEITVDGTIKLCEDLAVDPEDVVMLAVAYELKSPRVGEWTKEGWVNGWKNLRCDTIQSMREILPRQRDQLGSDPEYFQKVYNHTFNFARSEGQRSLALDTAQAFWALLLPHGLQGGALAHVDLTSLDHSPQANAPPRPNSTPLDRNHDVKMNCLDHDQGWKEEYIQWWFDFLREKGGKGVSKDTWQMFLEFIRSVDSRFSNYDSQSAWPSTIDDFVEYAKRRLQAEG